MGTADFEAQAVRAQLERALASAGFSHSERLSRFLRFVVERHLEGRDEELKESVIALEVFGNRDYDPKRDSIVRTEAGRVRARLAEYYLGEGGGDPVIIELPKGGYIPMFRRIGEARAGRNPRFGRRWLTVALASLAVTLAVLGWWQVRHNSAPITIAVLPLHNLSPDPANDYFADGLTSEIIRNLSIIDGLAVRSQTSSFSFKGKPRKVLEIGQQLGVDYVLEGSVLRAGQQLRINAQFIRVRDDFPLWTGRYDRELTDVFAIQDEISRGIVNSLRLRLGRGRRRYETSAEAYDLYLRARALQLLRPGYEQSIGPLEDAIAKDPSFAPAYAGLATAYAVRSGRFAFDGGGEAAKMRAAAERAIQLDPLSAEAHGALGVAYARDAQWERSEKNFRRAIELDPNLSQSYGDFAFFFLLTLGRIDEGLQQLRIAEKADPLSPVVQYELAYLLISAGRHDEAANYCQKLPADFQFKTYCLGRARLGQGRVAEAIQVLETALHRGVSPRAPIWGPLGCAYARAGRREEAEKLAAVSSLNRFNESDIFACLSDKDRTFEALDRAVPAGPFRIGRQLNHPEYAILRGDPRLKALRKKVGLPE
jgi:TolB-like protein/Tfp pilus assembly protein PilF